MIDLRIAKELIGMPMNITVEISSINQYLDIIKEIKRNYDCGFKGDALWYRGLSDFEKFSMLPSILRGQLFDYNDTQFYNEEIIFNSFKKESRSYIDVQNDNFLLLCYAQHFGVPTRLLDFSTNPLVALYFACKELKTKDGAIWILNSKKYNEEVLKIAKERENKEISIEQMQDVFVERVSKYTVPSKIYQFPIAVEPYYIDQRMNSQGSRFLLWGDTPVSLERLLCAEDYINNNFSNQNAFAKRLCIPSEKKVMLLNDLDMLGINEKSLFPGLDGVGKYIKNHFTIEKNKKK